MNIAGKQENLQEKNMTTKKDETAGKTARVVLNLNLNDARWLAAGLWEGIKILEEQCKHDGTRTLMTDRVKKIHDRITRGLEKQELKEIDNETEKKGIEAEAKANEAGESQ